ncbi:hypothetical protein Thiowin_02871 [Thiorhodovibrio winogradskyi]|uniref:Uncharacterized protein n=1 Tax=Thiorhodovibrio winogradskyi TaxID=77007 RepID=A0ABZ0SBD2_9GAMM
MTCSCRSWYYGNALLVTLTQLKDVWQESKAFRF